ncbi:hypothetical protein Plhal304r1_c018g0063801 [Plasmopara halstedii]
MLYFYSIDITTSPNSNTRKFVVMLRRHPTRVEERPDVADEYEAYLLEKEQKTGNKSKTSQQPSSISGAESDAMTTQQEKRRQEIRARIGLSSSR